MLTYTNPITFYTKGRSIELDKVLTQNIEIELIVESTHYIL